VAYFPVEPVAFDAALGGPPFEFINVSTVLTFLQS
jgi:hypothetical protein